MRKIDDDFDPEANDTWVVCNHSTEYAEYPANTGKILRIYLTVILVCQTIIAPKKEGEKVTRDDLTCKITYCSVGKFNYT